MATTPGFLAERLAAASAVPADQRSADVRAFIETCRLQVELAEELGVSATEELGDIYPSNLQVEESRSRWTTAAALKLVLSHVASLASLAGPLPHSPQLHYFAGNMLYLHSNLLRAGVLPPDLGQEWADILEGDPCLRKFAVLAAGLPVLGDGFGWGRGLVKMSTRVVKLMQRPDVRRRLRAELAALPGALVSYEELLAFFIEFGSNTALRLAAIEGWEASADAQDAYRLAVHLLPLLAPSSPRLRFRAAALGKGNSYPTAMAAVLDLARQQGSDYYVANCGYNVAFAVDLWVAEAAARPGVPPPSAVLGWLQEAEAAHRRCKAFLPKRWTKELSYKAAAAAAKASLLLLQQDGDTWRRLAAGERRDLDAAMEALYDSHSDPGSLRREFACSGCGRAAAQFRTCSACREAQYCSVECQRGHWREHKARCKEAQAAKADASTGAASGSRSGS